MTFEIFIQNATLNSNIELIKALICGYCREVIKSASTQQMRYMDKLVDELAKERNMEQILRVA